MKKLKKDHVPWKCPKCGSEPDKHGKGGLDACTYGKTPCNGFLCECEDSSSDGADHGSTLAEQCHNASCYHCGWRGDFPPSPFKLKGWMRTAWEAGWRPPAGWTPE